LREAPPPTPRCRRGEAGASPSEGDAPGAMPTNRGNGYDVSVVGEGSGPDAKAARPAESPRWAAGRGPGVGPGLGVGVAGYSRELLRGALTYAGRGVPVFPCEPGGKRPLTADGFLEATTDEALIRGWWGRWPNALPSRFLRESVRVSSSSTWTPVKARTRWPCSNSPVASPRKPRALRRVGEGCIYTSATLPYKS
jgi:Bifunctional DNA primase/polymerase, N-terminal